jgi:hypothetical protein
MNQGPVLSIHGVRTGCDSVCVPALSVLVGNKLLSLCGNQTKTISDSDSDLAPGRIEVGRRQAAAEAARRASSVAPCAGSRWVES